MAEQKIGIKVADGSFYPILDERENKKKRLVLTTVNDDQENVHIDLYRGTEENAEDASYIGSMVVDEISKGSSGEAEIEMVVGVDENGNLETTAEDKVAGAKQSFSVSLEDLEQEDLYETPDFSLEEEESVEETPEEAPAEEAAEEETPSEEEELSFEGLPDEEELEAGPIESGESSETGEEWGEESPEEEFGSGLPDLDTEFGEEDFDFGDFEEEQEEQSAAPEEEQPSGPEQEQSSAEETESIDFAPEEEQALSELESESAEPEIGSEEIGEEPFEEPFEEEPFEEELGAQGEEEEQAFDFEEESFGSEEESEESPFGTATEEERREVEEARQEGEEEKSRVRPILVGILVVLALALIGALTYLFVFMSQSEESVPPLEAQNEPIEEQQSTGTDVAEEGTEQQSDTQPTASDSTEEAPAEAPSEEDVEPRSAGEGGRENWESGVWYKIRWGDTLWGISSSFYDTPWLYNELANENDINNPDRIYAQDKIFIPEPENSQ